MPQQKPLHKAQINTNNNMLYALQINAKQTVYVYHCWHQQMNGIEIEVESNGGFSMSNSCQFNDFYLIKIQSNFIPFNKIEARNFDSNEKPNTL